ncbi:MAG: sigma-70 family RNA polymerase sigma factor [Deltaproteobacteria bacterium]|nr:sigma-70 family RNA polymerase sigma factor [Deltaproteobacteria bacterium]
MAEATASDRATALLDPIRAFVARRVPVGATDDVVQEVFVRIARSGTEPEDLRAWVYTVARSVIADHHRKSARRSARELPEEARPAESAEEDGATDDPGARAREVLQAWLAAEVGQLPSPYAETLALTELEGLGHAAVAERLGVARGTVKARVSRGRALLRERLAECCRVALDARNRVVDLTPNACGC